MIQTAPPNITSKSKATVVGSLYQIPRIQSKYKFKTKFEYNEQQLPPYPAGDWMKLEPRKSLNMYEFDEDKGSKAVSKSKHKRTGPQEDSTVVSEGKDKRTTTQHSTVIGEYRDQSTTTQQHSTVLSESTDKRTTQQHSTVEDKSEDEDGEESVEEDLYNCRSKRPRILRGPIWNYGIRKISADEEYYNNVLFGAPWSSLKTPDDMILRGTTFVPSRTITASMARFILKTLKKLGYKKTAMVEVETSRSLTYGEMADKVESLACGLHYLGVQESQVLAIVSYHSLEAHLMLLACLLLGAVAALVDSSLNAVELGIALRITNPNFLFTEPGKTLEKVDSALRSLELSLHSSKPLIIINSTIIEPSPEYLLFTQLLKEVNPLEKIPGPRKADPDRPILIMYTGSADNLRACLIPESCFSLIMAYMSSVLPQHDEPSVTVIVTPPMYCAIAIKAIINHYIDGHRVIVCRGQIPDPCLLTALRQYEVFAMLTLRSTLMSLLDWQAPPRCPHLKLVAVTGVPLRLKNLRRVHSQLFKDKVRILQFYGLVETGTIAANTFLANKHGSVGKLFYNVELKVLEEGTKLPLGPNQEGELCVRSRTMMLGYYNNPEANEEVFDSEGFLHTGDLGFYDEEDFVHVTSQVREMIRWRTYLVSPTLVEEVLIELPEIKEALVFGLSDEEDGELVSAAVILEFGYENTDVSELEKQANALLPDRRKIRGGIYVFTQFPRSTIGKPMRDYIVKEVMERKLLQRRKSTE